MNQNPKQIIGSQNTSELFWSGWHIKSKIKLVLVDAEMFHKEISEFDIYNIKQ